MCGTSSVGRASACQAEGRRFETGVPHHFSYLSDSITIIFICYLLTIVLIFFILMHAEEVEAHLVEVVPETITQHIQDTGEQCQSFMEYYEEL